ncbi:hypothetical protein BofuT4_uP046600.1 [Botrytis cinerea T4]|uniref:Uncharacterized protein n=1 Tax=Botryotinia fuckeliana (strain T4) TaxID=999810 RepID=G2XYV5_BOTF4|nr:hypothetical protein BofuT4_uP046600.1 [Botrytis cinerea T4]
MVSNCPGTYPANASQHHPQVDIKCCIWRCKAPKMHRRYETTFIYQQEDSALCMFLVLFQPQGFDGDDSDDSDESDGVII